MNTRPPLSALNAEQLRNRALECRQMASTARDGVSFNGLLKLAERFEDLAAKRAEAADHPQSAMA